MNSMKLTAIFEVFLPVQIKKEGKYFVSYCPPLDLFSQGVTRVEAKKNIKEAARLFILDCYERGTLEKVLKECGFVPLKKPIPQRPKSRREEIAVQLPFVINQGSGSWRA
jgi:predicted RNase H-like HicB family nuclease